MNKKLFLILCAFTLSFTAMGQGLKDVKINEVMVHNTDSFEDDFGHKVSWIELYNSGYASVNVGGAYLSLTGEGGKEVRYRIPSNDSKTLIPAQGYLIFFADGEGNKGTFHTNFDLGETGAAKESLKLFDQSGRNLMDELNYTVSEQIENESYGRMKQEDGSYKFEICLDVTPGQTNETTIEKRKSEIFHDNDPDGIAMAVTAMSVVFSALLLLYLSFRTIGNRNKAKLKAQAKKEAEAKGVAPAATKNAKVEGLTGEAIAAITIAVHMFEDELHDIESNVVTINKVARAYSPWSSKIYGLRQTPNKNKR